MTSDEAIREIEEILMRWYGIHNPDLGLLAWSPITGRLIYYGQKQIRLSTKRLKPLINCILTENGYPKLELQ